MKIPKNFLPDKKYKTDLMVLIKDTKANKIKKIEDLVLAPEEFEANYDNWSIVQLTEKEFKICYNHIQKKDVKNNLHVTYDKEDFEAPNIYILEYATKNSLQEHLNDIYEDCEGTMELGNEESCRPLIVERYAIIIESYKDLDRLEKVYRKRFGAKRLIKKVDTRLELK